MRRATKTKFKKMMFPQRKGVSLLKNSLINWQREC